MTTECQFQLNRQTVDLSSTDPSESLLRWLRRQRLAGTKEGCADGDCGACTVALCEPGDGGTHYQAVNSCLLPMGALPGRSVLTVEALSTRDDALHPVQQALVDCAGSQCGYCTPGIVMSLFAGYYNGELGDSTTEGNLCRCTGYRPIRMATEQLARQPAGADAFSAALDTVPPPAAAAMRGYFSPASIADALALKARHPDALWIAGATDLGVELSHGKRTDGEFIALDRIAELRELDIRSDAVRIGAGVALSLIEARLDGLFPALDQMLPWFAARQVRNRATLGGNLGTASPIGDLLPVLLALDATVHLRGADRARDVPADAFFLDYRKTARQPDELITAVTLPRRAAGEAVLRREAAYKVAKRQTDDISIVAAVFVLELDAARQITQVRLAYGGVAAVPRRAHTVENYLHGRPLDAASLQHARDLLHAEFQPLSDHRAGADYRRALCANLFAKFIAEQFPALPGAAA